MADDTDQRDEELAPASRGPRGLGRLLLGVLRALGIRLARPQDAEAARLAGLLLAHNPDAVLVVDESWRVLQASAAAQPVFGAPPSALRGRRVDDLLPGFTGRFRAEAEARCGYGRTPLGWRWRGEARRATGECHAVEVASLWSHGEGGFPAAISVRDASCDEQAVRTMQSANRELADRLRQVESQLDARAQLFARVCHEVRGMLVPLVAGAELARMEAHDVGCADLDGTLDDMILGGYRLRDLLERNLVLSKIEAGTMSVELEPTVLAPLCQEAVDQFRAMAAIDGTRLVCEVPAVEAAALADPMRLRQVLRNLVDNAVTYAPGGTVTVRIERPSAPARTGIRRVRIQVEDTGQGIPPEQFASLFDPYSQGRRDLRRGEGGVGLGLAIAQRLVERMGGTLQAASRPGKGSTLTVELAEVDSKTASPPSIILDPVGPPVLRKAG